MTRSFQQRYLTATRYALFEQAHNRLALGLLVVFVPIWYAAIGAMMPEGVPAAFQFQPTQTWLQVDGHNLGLLTAGLSALTLIVGFMFFIAARKNTEFDHRLVLSGYPQPLLILGKLTGLVIVTALVSLYASVVLLAFWRPENWLLVWLGFWCAALIYGAFGLLLGVLVQNELAGFFLIIMTSMLDTFFQNPVDNPIANQPFLKFLPSYAPTQVYVAGGFTQLLPGQAILLALAWFAGFALLGLAIFWGKTRARKVQIVSLASKASGEWSPAHPQPDAESLVLE